MTRDEILDEWNQDGIIDPAHLDIESLNIPRLHAKYLRYLSDEKMLLRASQSEYKKLYLTKYVWITQGDTKETKEKGWELPPQGCIMKVEVDKFLDADEDLIKSRFKIFGQEEKVRILDDIMKSIHSRNFLIRAAIDFQRFQAGN